MNGEVRADLLTRWNALAGHSAEDAGRELIRRWSEPHRHYHRLTHLAAVLDAIDDLVRESDGEGAGDGVVDTKAVRLAAWFHDAVYDGRPGDDERASAELARDVLTRLGQPSDRVDEVERLVLLTASHDPAPGDLNGAVLCDADLAVLGGSPAEYAEYASAVRRDYASVPDREFNAGRASVLERLLAKDPLFATVAGRRRWEATARRNLETELTLLRATAP